MPTVLWIVSDYNAKIEMKSTHWFEPNLYSMLKTSCLHKFLAILELIFELFHHVEIEYNYNFANLDVCCPNFFLKTAEPTNLDETLYAWCTHSENCIIDYWHKVVFILIMFDNFLAFDLSTPNSISMNIYNSVPPKTFYVLKFPSCQ